MAETENLEVVNDDENTKVILRDTGTYDEKSQMFTLDNILPFKWRKQLLIITSWS